LPYFYRDLFSSHFLLPIPPNGKHQLLVYADNVNILVESVHIINENIEGLVIDNKEPGLEVNSDKTKYMVMPQDYNAGRSHSIKLNNRSFEMLEEFKYLGTILTDQNSNGEQIRSRFKSGNVCYHSVQNLLSSSLLTKNLKIKIYRTIILSVVVYGCEIWSLALRDERGLRVFKNRKLRKIFGSTRDEVIRD